MQDNKSDLKRILDSLITSIEKKELSKEQIVLIKTHIKIINEILDKNLDYEKKMIDIYKQIVEVFSNEQKDI